MEDARACLAYVETTEAAAAAAAAEAAAAEAAAAEAAAAAAPAAAPAAQEPEVRFSSPPKAAPPPLSQETIEAEAQNLYPRSLPSRRRYISIRNVLEPDFPIGIIKRFVGFQTIKQRESSVLAHLFDPQNKADLILAIKSNRKLTPPTRVLPMEKLTEIVMNVKNKKLQAILSEPNNGFNV